MSIESRRRIKPINEDGKASIKAQMRTYYRKSKIAEIFGDDRSAKDNMQKFRALEAKLTSRERLRCL